MRGWIWLVIATNACSIDSTGLLPAGDAETAADAPVLGDASLNEDTLNEDASPNEDASNVDARPDQDATLRDAAQPDVPVRDAGPADAPVDTPPDVPPDVFDAGPMEPEPCTDPGLLTCYLFDGDVLDSSPNARHLSPVDVAFEAIGAVGGAVALNETSQLSLPGPALGLGTDFSLEVWFRMERSIAVANDRWGVVDVPGVLGVFVHGTNDPTTTKLKISFRSRPLEHDISTDGWHHVVIVSNNDMVRLTIDGETEEIEEDASSNDDPGILHVGSNATRDPRVFEEQFLGNIDHLRIWDRVLSEAEVTALFP